MNTSPAHNHGATASTPTLRTVSKGLWREASGRLLRDRWAMTSLVIICLFFLLTLLTASGLIASNWSDEVAVSYAPPSLFATLPDAQDMALGHTPDSGLSDTSAASTASTASVDNTDSGRWDADRNKDDPLAGLISQLHTDEIRESGHDPYGIPDPLARDLNTLSAHGPAAYRAASKLDSLPFGADIWGHDVLLKTIKGAQVSIVVGLFGAILASLIGTVTGALAGYLGGWVDDFLNWIYYVLTAIPYLLLVLAIAAVLQQRGVTVIVLILALTGWTGTFRAIRAEYIRLRSRDYLLAAASIGVSHSRRMLVHIFPNVMHIVLVQTSMSVVGFIKSEVILSFLGFGVPVGSVSWGSILNEAPNELLLGKWWQLATVTVMMALLITAFSVFTDAVRDALDPRAK